MKRILMASVVILCIAIGLACAQDRATATEAKAMLDKAVAFYKTNGSEKAFAAFNDPKGPFVDKDLYIFVLDLNGTVIAHSIKPGLVGKGTKQIRDANERNFLVDMVTVAESKGVGTVDYWWENPRSGIVEEKRTYVEKVNGVILGCGYYTGRRWEPRVG